MRRKLNGFMGRTHSLLSLMIFFICVLFPLYPVQSIVSNFTGNALLFIISMVVLSGGALLPDCDNYENSVKYSVGPLGSIFTIFMKSTSAVMWNIYHFKGDMKPENQHRYLWHTPPIGIGLILLFYFGIPNGEYSIFTNISSSIKTGQLGEFIKQNTIITLFLILCFMSILVGTNAIIRLANKIVPIPFFVKYILPVLSIVYVMTTNYSNIRVLGVCLGAGYLFHCLEDFFADSGIPIFWPIPKFWGSQKKVWWRPKIPFRVTTGGIVNTVVDILAGVIVLILFVLVVIKIK